MKPYRNFDDRLKKELKNPEFKKAFDQEEIFASLAIQIVQLRQKTGIKPERTWPGALKRPSKQCPGLKT